VNAWFPGLAAKKLYPKRRHITCWLSSAIAILNQQTMKRRTLELALVIAFFGAGISARAQSTLMNGWPAGLLGNVVLVSDPATLALAGMGGLGLLLFRRRKI
jgi:hypothetical protein